MAIGLVPRTPLGLLISCPLQRRSVLVVVTDVLLFLLFFLLVGLSAKEYTNPGGSATLTERQINWVPLKSATRGQRQSPR